MKKIIPLLWMFLAPLVLAASSWGAPPDASVNAPTDPVLGAQGKVSVWSYSKAFAKRFNLPEMVEEGFPPDIWAMEFRLIRRILDRDASFYDCELHVYVNNKLKILYPEGEMGSIETLAMGNRALLGKMANTEDRVFHGDQMSSYSMKAVFSSKGEKNSLGGTVTYRYYRKYFLSDLAYLAFSLSGCSSIGSPDEYNFSLWVEKEGGRDYRQWSKLDPKDFYQFEIPKAFVQRFYPQAKLAAEKNSTRIDAENKARREKLQRQKDSVTKH